MPLTISRIALQDHSGSTADDVKSEPDWRVVLGERLIGYSNRLDRRPGLTHSAGPVVIVIRSRRSFNGIRDEKEENLRTKVGKNKRISEKA